MLGAQIRMILVAGLGLLAGAFHSCAPEASPAADRPCTRQIVLSASVDDPPTKVSFADDRDFSWDAGDRIACLLKNEESGEFLLLPAGYDGQPGSSSGPFSLWAPEGFHFAGLAAYPDDGLWQYDAVKGSLSRQFGQYYLLSDKAEMPMVAVGEKDHLLFKHAGGMVKVTVRNIPSDAKVFTLVTDKRISGNYTWIPGEGFLCDDGEDAISRRAVFVVSGQRRDELTFYYPVPSGEFRLGYTISGSKGNVFRKDVGEAPNSICPGTILRMPPLTISLPGGYKTVESAGKEKLGEGETWTLEDFPYYLKKRLEIRFSADLQGPPDSLFIGKGYGRYRGDWICITKDRVLHQHVEQSTGTKASLRHGLSFSSHLEVSMVSDNAGRLTVCLSDGAAQKELVFPSWAYEANYQLFVMSRGTPLKHLRLSATSPDFDAPVWVMGDSYLNGNTSRWPGVLLEAGYNAFLLDGLAGIGSGDAFPELERLLQYGQPQILFWTLGMNDTTENWMGYVRKVAALCAERGIEMVLATIPTVPSRDKEAISAYVRGSGYRYVDFYAAVGTNPYGAWTDGYLSSDGVHPTALGAKAMAARALQDLPELAF